MNIQSNIMFANEFLEFLNEGCTAFHAVDATISRLENAGFTCLLETDVWNLSLGGKYYFTRNNSTVFAFTIGGKYQPGNGYTVLGAHTDSPCLKIKPVSCVKRGDALMLNTDPYGGGLWHTWFDRDLGIAGKVILKSENGGLFTRLLRIDSPVARIPNLAIHLTDRSTPFSPNLHEHCKAILTMESSSINCESSSDSQERLHPFLLQLVSDKLCVSPDVIVDMELQLIDIQPPTLGGANNELLFSGRLDNLCSSYQCLRALIDGASEDLVSQENIRLITLFDHEEVGSGSCVGAGSPMFLDTLKSINQHLTDGSHSTLMRSLRKSIVISADMAHAIHPNYPSKHDSSTAPRINGGIVIKNNCNQRYATNSISASLFREMAKLDGAKVQEFSVRADMGCGSTIGPITSALTGILTVDVGTPQFSMHSIREMMGSYDALNGYIALKAVLKHHPTLVAKSDLETSRK